MNTPTATPTATPTPTSTPAAPPAAPALDVSALCARVACPVLTPLDEGYADAVRPWNLVMRQAPAVAVIPTTSAEVAAAVRFARAANVPVGVQATGHGMARGCDGGLLLLTRELDEVHIDAAARTATVGAGALWGAVLAPAQEHGLAPLLGSTTHVGAVGYTLGGGMGWIGRRYGLGADSVRSFELVTPDGIEVTVSATEQPELFWALRGGGAGSLGVVTRMEIELYPVSTVVAGNLFYPVELAEEVMERWRDWTATVGEELTSSVVLMNFPPLDLVPEPLRGRSFVMVRGCWCGDVAEGEALWDGWRQWRAPEIDMVAPMPFSQADAISQDPVDPVPAMVTTEWFDTLPDDALALVRRAALPRDGAPPAIVFAEIRHAGGAIRRLAAGTANEPGRSGEYLLELGGMVPFPEAGPVVAAALSGTRAALAPYVTGAAYLNFTEGEEKRARTASACTPRALERLRAVKAALDPHDRFRHGVDFG